MNEKAGSVGLAVDCAAPFGLGGGAEAALRGVALGAGDAAAAALAPPLGRLAPSGALACTGLMAAGARADADNDAASLLAPFCLEKCERRVGPLPFSLSFFGGSFSARFAAGDGSCARGTGGGLSSSSSSASGTAYSSSSFCSLPYGSAPSSSLYSVASRSAASSSSSLSPCCSFGSMTESSSLMSLDTIAADACKSLHPQPGDSGFLFC